MGSRSRSTACSRLAIYFSRPKCKGRAGMPGARCTRGLVCKSYSKRRTRAYRSTEITRHPRTQWLYGLWRDLPGSPARFVTVAGGMNSTDLTPACGIRTTRFFRPYQALNVKSTFRGHRSPPRVCDDRETPLCLGRDAIRIIRNSGRSSVTYVIRKIFSNIRHFGAPRSGQPGIPNHDRGYKFS